MHCVPHPGGLDLGRRLHGVWRDMVRNNMVDAIVATGASIVDMDFEALGFKHYQAREIPDDRVLRDLYIDRIYDTYIDEEDLQHCDHTIKLITDSAAAWPRFPRALLSLRWANGWLTATQKKAR
ncbi:MAG: deoxyhypusine synthase family protein [Parvularculaceae bacterium]